MPAPPDAAVLVAALREILAACRASFERTDTDPRMLAAAIGALVKLALTAYGEKVDP